MKFSYSLIKRLLPGVPPVKKLADALNIHSFEVETVEGDMLDVKIPANQYSAMASHSGIAREAAAIFRLPFKGPAPTMINIPARKGFVKVKIEEPALCLRYAARVFDLTKIGDSSPAIKKILHTCGINSVNAVVDLMNLVMLETGQPLHAFDAATIKGGLRLRRARKNETIETLDKKTVALDPSVLVIADEEHVLAIAGMKGGSFSGVTNNTKRIVVEAANFDGVSIYQSSRALKLTTDASILFSHGISPAKVVVGLDRVTELLTKSGARLIDSIEAGNVKTGDAIIDFDPAAFEHMIGISAPIADVKRYFTALGFSIEAFAGRKPKNVLRVRVPAWRNDVEYPEDLYEEVARLMGYNNLPKQAPFVFIMPTHEDDAFILKDKLSDIMLQMGFDEVYSSSFYGTAGVSYADEAGIIFDRGAEHVMVENPVSDDRTYLRKSLIPVLMDDLESNARYYDAVRIFEIGKVFADNKGVMEERTAFGVLIAAQKDETLILELKGVMDELLRSVGIDNVSLIGSGDTVRIEADHAILGHIRGKRFPRGWTVAYAEIDLAKTLASTEEGKEFVPLKRFPAVTRDISVLVGDDVRIGDIINTIEDVNPTLIETVDLIDEYKNEKLGGKQSITFRIIFQADDRTLKDAEVNDDMKKISQKLHSSFRAEVR